MDEKPNKKFLHYALTLAREFADQRPRSDDDHILPGFTVQEGLELHELILCLLVVADAYRFACMREKVLKEKLAAAREELKVVSERPPPVPASVTHVSSPILAEKRSMIIKSSGPSLPQQKERHGILGLFRIKKKEKHKPRGL